MESSLNVPFEKKIPTLLLPIMEVLKKAGIFLTDEEMGLRPATISLEQRAVRAVNEALRHAVTLHNEPLNLPAAARLLEKIQLAAVDAERAAYIVHAARAEYSFRLARRIASFAREMFHDLKEKGQKKAA